MIRLISFLSFIFCLTLFSISSRGCHLTDLNLVSVSGTGPYTIVVRLCVGQGITGAVKGANFNTNIVSFGLVGPGLILSSFSPASITGSFTGCTMDGYNIGPQGMPYSSDATVLYLDPGYYGLEPCLSTPYACINSTALCGNVSVMCTDFTFVTNVMPTLIQAFGVEGAGNPVAGCYADDDTRITNFTLSVEWNELNAVVTPNQTVQLNWSTFSEKSSNYYVVEKTKDISSPHTEWLSLDTISARNTDQLSHYFYEDDNLTLGISYYRIKEVDLEGDYSFSKILIVNSEEQSIVKVYPNPVESELTIESNSHESLELFNSFGSKVYSSSIMSGISEKINTESFSKGIYFLKLITPKGSALIQKIIVN